MVKLNQKNPNNQNEYRSFARINAINSMYKRRVSIS